VGFRPPVFNLLSLLETFFSKKGISAYIVGGFIRDFALNRTINDLDLAITDDSFSVGKELADSLGGRLVKLDEANLVARIILPENLSSSGSIKHLDLNTLQGDIITDLSRRDFTLNAMACPIAEWPENPIPGIIPENIIDPYLGRISIKENKIVAVSNQAFEDDALRLLRGVRLAGELGFHIEENTWSLIKEQHHHIEKTASERIRDELLLIFKLSNTGEIIKNLSELGLLDMLIPELAPCRATTQPKEHHWNVFWHSVKCIDAVEFLLGSGEWPFADNMYREQVPLSRELIDYFNEPVSSDSTRLQVMKLAALLHDVAKPATRIINGSGRIRFFGHPAQGAPMARDILTRLRFTSREIKMASEMTLHHLRPVQMNQPGEMPTDRAIYRYLRDTGEVAIDTLFLSLADHLSARGPALVPSIWKAHCDIVEHVIRRKRQMESCKKEAGLINGHDLLDNFRLSPGPVIKNILEAVNEAQVVGDISTREQALELAEKIISNQGLLETDRRSYRQGKGIIKPK